MSVSKTVSDIYRAYFSQALFPKINLKIGFLPRPIVVRNKTEDLESIERALEEELDLHTKTSTLISYLNASYLNSKSTESNEVTFVEVFENLWIDMYERGYIEEKDVDNVKSWIEALFHIGYKFPRSNTEKMEIYKLNKQVAGSISLHNLAIKRTINNLGNNINISPIFREKCDVKYHLTFANSDLHDGPKIDIPSILLNMGQKYVNVGPRLSDLHKKWNLKERNPEKNYPDLMKMPGMLFDQDNVSQPLDEYSRQTLAHSTKMNFSNYGSMENYEFYRHDKLINEEVSAYICSFPAAMCQIWKHMNKPILLFTAHRYNLGRCTQHEWKGLDSDLAKWSDPSSSNLGHTVGAVSRYDLEYLKYYNPHLALELIPSLGELYMKVKKDETIKRNEILIFRKKGNHYGAVPQSLPNKEDIFISNIKNTLRSEFQGDTQILYH